MRARVLVFTVAGALFLRGITPSRSYSAAPAAPVHGETAFRLLPPEMGDGYAA